ncbi:MAG TPA: hypothetical protein VMW38_00770 [Terriglobia bacterium]|nr:hypothetical protein [Terriglobia bacterium]
MTTPAKFKAFVLVIVVFALGLVLGASLATTFVSRKLAAAGPTAPKDVRHHMMDTFKTRLALSPAEEQKLQVIFDDAHQQFKALHATVKPQFDAIRSQMRDRIREILDDKQKKEFEVMVQEYDRREREHNR